jgi:hypothetical protein
LPQGCHENSVVNSAENIASLAEVRNPTGETIPRILHNSRRSRREVVHAKLFGEGFKLAPRGVLAQKEAIMSLRRGRKISNTEPAELQRRGGSTPTH